MTEPEGPSTSSGPPVEGTPLTRSQMMIWLGQRLNPEVPLYNMAHAFTLRGPLDPVAFGRAVQAFVDRSDAFRTIVVERDGEPRQVVLEHVDVPSDPVDFRSDAHSDEAARAWIRAHAERAFDLGRGLFESALLRLSDDRWVWFLNQHHLITDAWSTTLVFRRVTEYYERALDGTLESAAPLPLYAAFGAFERRRRSAPGRRAIEAFWDEQRERAPATMPALYGEDAATGTSTDRLTIDLGADRSARLRELAGHADVRALTPHLSLLNVFAVSLFVYLHRVSGRNDLAIGTPAHNRPTGPLKETPGLFTEVLPLRVDLREGESFQSLLERVREAANAVLLHVQPGVSTPDLARGFNVVLNYINATLPHFQGEAVDNLWIHPGHGDPRQVLRLQVHDFEGSGRLHLSFDMNSSVFDEPLRRAATDHFLRVLDAFLDDRSQAIDAFSLLSATECERQVVDWNRTERAEPIQTVVQLFEDCAAGNPDRIALRAGTDRITYAELSARSDRLARRLLSRGVGSGSRVGLYLERSCDFVIATLATLKAGAAYVPIDSAYPRDRVEYILDDAQVGLIVSHRDLASRLTGFEVAILDFGSPQPHDDEAPLPARPAPPEPAYDGMSSPPPSRDVDEAPLPLSGSEDDAYVIYTSGSTGRPKGVVIQHAALANYVTWATEAYGGGLTFPLFSSVAFDLTVTSLFVPLVSGGEIVVYEARDGAVDLALFDVVEDDRVDIVKLTPSHLRLLRDRDLKSSRIDQLIVGGEDLPTGLAVAISRAFGGDVILHNEYGPTEATVGATVHRFRPEMDGGASVPVGRPIANTRIYVLDGNGHPVPRGVTGEIHIAGAGLARGYWNRPELTTERFVPDPFTPGDLMYRTGDLARFGAGGELEFQGRRDEQVKVRGARVELGEIEAALLEHPRIQAAVVAPVAPPGPPDRATERHCVRCGLPGSYPGASFDGSGTCNLCRAFETYQRRAQAYFRALEDLEEIVTREERTRTAPYDCLALLSGGKDSTYMLAQLVDMGLRVLAFTLDNGFLSEQAKDNIRRVVGHLGVDHEFGTTPAMNEIFVDSLERHSNVCNGCFKTIYTLSLQRARALGIPFIVTGLSRGQFFETRLTEELFTDPEFDADRIDRTILDARKAYHRVDDAVRRLLDTAVFDDDRIFEEIRFLDFYRYSDVGLEEMIAYLDERLPWERPSDTGRSTNCLINDVGIYVHKNERGYHNYAFPYSWDVRIGHKRRDEALAELDDSIDPAHVYRILREIGYEDAFLPRDRYDVRLAAYYVASEALSPGDLRTFLAGILPDFMVPSHFVRLAELPLTSNGKVDRAALPDPREERPERGPSYAAPDTETETALAEIWKDVIRIRDLGVRDNFFDLGGDSIMAIQIVARANRRGIHLTPAQLFEHQTVAELAAAAGTAETAEADQGRVTGLVPLTPVQRWFFEKDLPDPDRWSQALLLAVEEPLDPSRLQEALRRVLEHHDALRLRFRPTGSGWVQESLAQADPALVLQIDLNGLDGASKADRIADAEAEVHARIDLSRGRLMGTALFRDGDGGDRLLIVIHHLAVDGVSWPLLLEDLQIAYRGTDPLPPKTTSYKHWAESLGRLMDEGGMESERPHWDAVVRATAPLLPGARAAPGLEGAARTVSETLDPDETTRLLHDVPTVYHTQINEVLLTALASTIRDWTGSPLVRIDLEGHGREDIVGGVNLSRTVGWFTSLFPTVLDLAGSSSPGEALRTVKEQLRAVPNRGVGYGLLRYLGDATTRRAYASAAPAEILFNYLGRFDRPLADDSMFRFARPLSLTRDDRGRRSHRLEINVWVTDGRLRAEWRFTPEVDEVESVRALAGDFVEALRTIVRHCDSPAPGGGVSPSDFPLAGLDAGGLDKLARLLGDLDNPSEPPA